MPEDVVKSRYVLFIDSLQVGRQRVHKPTIDACVKVVERFRKVGKNIKKKLEAGEIVKNKTHSFLIVKIKDNNGKTNNQSEEKPPRCNNTHQGTLY